MKDLADYAYPLTDLFAQPTSSDQWDRYRLSQEKIVFFSLGIDFSIKKNVIFS